MCLTLRAHPQQLELEAVGDGSNKKATVHFLEIANGDDPYEVSKPPRPAMRQHRLSRSHTANDHVFLRLLSRLSSHGAHQSHQACSRQRCGQSLSDPAASITRSLWHKSHSTLPSSVQSSRHSCLCFVYNLKKLLFPLCGPLEDSWLPVGSILHLLAPAFALFA